ncbi:hypothetical protein M422DRAFT_58022 [Sphaerobolus stellatus SS14]|nr:hypothetical protein M422DRAFT_58022 [Sphaerobolus stellatus SS14]
MELLFPQPSPGQTQTLPTERTKSSIRQNAPTNWEYPSPQEFYNALVQKGHKAPEDVIVNLVNIHNRLNEDAWVEVIKWESRFGPGPSEAERTELAEFVANPLEVSNKAKLYQSARRFLPNYLTFAPPFDRHDWIIRRPKHNTEFRYIIDYYKSRKSADAETEFHMDVRPAMDNLEAALMRLRALLWDLPFMFWYWHRPAS